MGRYWLRWTSTGSYSGPSKHRSSKKADEASSRSDLRKRSELSDSWSPSYDGGAAVPSVQAGLMETTARPALETVARASEVDEESGEVNQPGSADDLPVQWTQPCRRRRNRSEAEEKTKAAFERSRVSNDKGPRRGWLGDLTDGILPDDGLCIGRSKTVPGGQQGWGNPWKANGSLHCHQKVVKHFGNMISSPSGKWLRWRFHEVKSKVLFCHRRPSQPCHGDVIVRALAEERHR